MCLWNKPFHSHSERSLVVDEEAVEEENDESEEADNVEEDEDDEEEDEEDDEADLPLRFVVVESSVGVAVTITDGSTRRIFLCIEVASLL